MLKDTPLLPVDLQRIYNETVRAMNNDLPVLVGVGIRAIVETVCRDRKAAGRNLQDKVDDLVKVGVLTRDGSDILHKIRSLGNVASRIVLRSWTQRHPPARGCSDR